ncbi:MAG: hypothetical protein EOO03_13010 [Chitinophagaceae bacterium]|nr:MAG: hypothetical protein EOO03_13010 [Chitinophagaceae bacterium]
MLIKHCRFSIHFDVDRLQRDVDKLQAAQWKEHYNKSNYDGEWTTLQLRALGGSPDNNTAMQSSALQLQQSYLDTPMLQQCEYIPHVLNFFKAEKTAVRLMKLSAGAIIKPHRDYDLNLEQGEARIHVPIYTHAAVHFMLQDERIVMDEGSCWYLNLSLPHSVKNLGTKDRIHLVIDLVANDWLRNYFQETDHAIAMMEEPPAQAFKDDDKLKMIAELRRMQTPMGNQLADEMEATLRKPTK